MSNHSPQDEIRSEMAAARAALAHDARAAAADARTLTDWRHHFRAHPWLYCGGALALGFLLIPRGGASLAAPAAAGAGGALSPPHRPQASGLAATALSMAATVAARQSLNFLTRRGMDWLALQAAKQREPEQLPAGGPLP